MKNCIDPLAQPLGKEDRSGILLHMEAKEGNDRAGRVNRSRRARDHVVRRYLANSYRDGSSMGDYFDKVNPGLPPWMAGFHAATHNLIIGSFYLESKLKQFGSYDLAGSRVANSPDFPSKNG